MRADNPYVGPRPFRYGETLYGRRRETFELIDRLVADRILLLSSPSGAGKTSLINAGLRPYLERDGFDVLPIARVGHRAPPDVVLPPGTNRYLLSVLMSFEEHEADHRLPLDQLAAMGLERYLEERAARRRGDGRRATGASEVLVFDQFEEVLTQNATDHGAKHEFFQVVGRLLRNRDRWALFAMREEFVSALSPFTGAVPTRLASTYRLDLLDPLAAREAIQGPAADAGGACTDPAADALVQQLRLVRVQLPGGGVEEQPGPYIEPMQLQVVCRLLWDKLPAGSRTIDAVTLESIGSVDSALSSYYAAQVTAAAEASGVTQRAIRDWFGECLITPQGLRSETLDAPRGDTGDKSLETLLNAYLVRADRRRGATWYELAHDRLVRPVLEDNRRWYEQNLNQLQTRARRWVETDRTSDDTLLSDAALHEARKWAAANPSELTEVEREFLEASEKREQNAKFVHTLVRLLALAAVVMLVAAIASLSLWRRASTAEGIASRAAEEATIAAKWAEEAKVQADAAEGRLLAVVRQVVDQYGWEGEPKADDIDRVLAALLADPLWERTAAARSKDARRGTTMRCPSTVRKRLWPILEESGFAMVETPGFPGCDEAGVVRWSGRVAPDDVRLVALTMIRAGLTVRSLEPSGDGGAAPVIDVTCRADLPEGGPGYTAEQVMAFDLPVATATATAQVQTTSVDPPAYAAPAPPAVDPRFRALLDAAGDLKKALGSPLRPAAPERVTAQAFENGVMLARQADPGVVYVLTPTRGGFYAWARYQPRLGRQEIVDKVSESKRPELGLLKPGSLFQRAYYAVDEIARRLRAPVRAEAEESATVQDFDGGFMMRGVVPVEFVARGVRVSGTLVLTREPNQARFVSADQGGS